MTSSRTTRQVGSGITEREEIEIEGSGEDVRAVMDELAALYDKDPITVIYDWATEALAAEGLPTSYTVRYPADDPTAWQVHSDPVALTGYKYATVGHYVVNVRGFAPDTPEGYAARLLERMKRMEQHPRSAFEAGYIAREALMKWSWEGLALRGMRFPTGSQRGRTDSLEKWLHEYLRKNPSDGIEAVWAALKRDPKAQPGNADKTVVFDGKPRTRSTVQNRLSNVKRKRQKAAEQWLQGR